MIQRIQSVYLLLASLAFGSEYLFKNIWTGPAASDVSWFLPATMALFGVAAAGSFAVIFLYGNRERQRKFIVGMQVVAILCMLFLFGGLYLAGSLPVGSTGPTGLTDWLGVLLPVLAYGFLYLARRAVDKDIKLVKSMDRIR